MNAARGAKRVWAIAKKEVMHIRRDPWTFWFALGMPVLLLVLFGYAVSFDIDHIPVVVVDQDRTPASRELVRHLFTGQTFRREADVDDAVAAEAAFRRGEARLAVVIPPDYGVHVARGGRAEVQLLIDAADNQTAGNVLSYTGRFGAATNARFLREQAFAQPSTVEARVRALFNPGLKSALFLVPGLIAMKLRVASPASSNSRLSTAIGRTSMSLMTISFIQIARKNSGPASASSAEPSAVTMIS